MDRQLPKQLFGEVWGLLPDDFLVILKELLFVEILEEDHGPWSDNQVQFLDTEVLGSVEHLPSKGCYVLLESEVLDELPAVVSDLSEMVAEVHVFL